MELLPPTRKMFATTINHLHPPVGVDVECLLRVGGGGEGGEGGGGRGGGEAAVLPSHVSRSGGRWCDYLLRLFLLRHTF